jgi:hypothetical protein
MSKRKENTKEKKKGNQPTSAQRHASAHLQFFLASPLTSVPVNDHRGPLLGPQRGFVHAPGVPNRWAAVSVHEPGLPAPLQFPPPPVQQALATGGPCMSGLSSPWPHPLLRKPCNSKSAFLSLVAACLCPRGYKDRDPPLLPQLFGGAPATKTGIHRHGREERSEREKTRDSAAMELVQGPTSGPLY